MKEVLRQLVVFLFFVLLHFLRIIYYGREIRKKTKPLGLNNLSFSYYLKPPYYNRNSMLESYGGFMITLNLEVKKAYDKALISCRVHWARVITE